MKSCTSFWNFSDFSQQKSVSWPLLLNGLRYLNLYIWYIDFKKVFVPSKSTIADILSYMLGSVYHFSKCFPKSGRAGPKLPIFGTFFTFPAGGKLIVVFWKFREYCYNIGYFSNKKRFQANSGVGQSTVWNNHVHLRNPYLLFTCRFWKFQNILWKN